jgi:hypothetical protein
MESISGRWKGMSQVLDDRKPSQLKGKPEEGLDFILWKAELNRELSLFWKGLFDN